MPDERTHYERLGVPADATVEVVRRAFRVLVKTAHPDAGGDPEAFRLLREAHDTLCDGEARRAYDERLGIRRAAWRSTADPGGWSGPQGDFTGDVDFPAWLRDVTEAPWEASAQSPPVEEPWGARAGGARAPLPAEVGWWWPHAATRPPVPAGALVLLTSGRQVAACDPFTGHEAWRLDLGSRAVAGPVVVDGRTVVVADEQGGVQAFELGRGVQRWHRRGSGAAVGLVPTEGGVVVAAGPTAVALDEPDGRPRWTARLAGPAVQLHAAGSGTVVAATARRSLEGIELRRGRHRFSLSDVPPPADDPVWVADRLWLLAGGGRLVGLDVGRGAADVAATCGLAVSGMAAGGGELYVCAGGPSQLVALDPRGRTRWTLGLPAVALAPAVEGPLLHVVGADAVLRRVDVATGRLRREASLQFEPAAPPVAVGGGRVLVPDRAGTVWCLLPPPERV